MEGSGSKQQVSENGGSNSEPSDSEPRPGGARVQRREDEVESKDSMVGITVYHESKQHGIVVPAKSTFGGLKQSLAPLVGIKPEEQRLLFRGKEKNDREYLHDVGVKNMSKVVLLEDPASRERRIEQKQREEGIVRACNAVLDIKHEVNKLARKVSALESSVRSGSQVADREFVVLTELLMRQLLKLDGIEAEGEAKVRRRSEVHRIQQYVEKIDALKAAPPIDPIPDGNTNNGNSISAQSQAFDSGRAEDQSADIRELISLCRVRRRDSSSYQSEDCSSACRRRRLHLTESPGASHQLLTPDDMPSGSKLSSGIEPIISDDLCETSNVNITANIVAPQAPSNPSTTAPTALNPPPKIPPSVFDRSDMSYSSWPEIPPVVPGVEYQPEIHHRYPSSPDPRNQYLHDNSLKFLRDVISRLSTPGSPESLNRFTSYANSTLELLARTGLDVSTLRHWEKLCREAEFLIQQMKALSDIPTAATLKELSDHADNLGVASNLANDEFCESWDAMIRHQKKYDDIGSEIDGLTVKLRDLWKEYMSLLSKRTELQVMQDMQAKVIESEQSRYKIRESAMKDADNAYSRAVDESVNAESLSLKPGFITVELRDLQDEFI